MAMQIQLRRGTAAEWTTANPTLAQGEMGLETDTSKFKIGNGATAWISLAYSSGIQGTQGTQGTIGIQGIQGPSIDAAMPIQTAKTANYTIATGDQGQLIQMNSASALTLSIPTDATFNFAIGTQISVVQISTGQVTIAAVTPGTTTVNATPGLKLRAQWAGATLVKRAANTWWVSGDLTA